MIRRSPIRRKRRIKSVSWRTGRIREDATGMAKLRAAAYERSQGICECGRLACLARPLRLRRVNWADGHLHHLWPRSDELSRVQFITDICHREIHGKPQLHWIPK